MGLLQNVSEGLARKTSRRGLLGRSAEIATGALLGAAAGTLTRPGSATAEHITGHTACAFPGPPCPCAGCNDTGVCAKPCVIHTTWYANGCWVTFNDQLQIDVTCCDCDCNGLEGVHTCGCGTDHHNDPGNCPDGKAQG